MGSGKSTTFNMITGSTKISGGHAFVNGHDMGTESYKVYI